MGIASLILAVIAVASVLLLIVVGLTVGATFHNMPGEETPFDYLLGTWCFATILVCICGIVFGIGGLRQANRRHSLAMIGLCANIAMPLGLLFLLAIGPPPRPTGSAARSSESSAGQVVRTGTTCLILAVAGVVAVRIRKRSIVRVSPGGSDSVACRRCNKLMPCASKFCRRCGLELPASGSSIPA
jgi:amino acid transporter